MQEVPLPSSATIADPSENATDVEEATSNGGDELMEDTASDMGSVATSLVAASAARNSADGPSQHLPLTREMLEMIQPYSVFGGAPAIRGGVSSHRTLLHGGVNVSESRPSRSPTTEEGEDTEDIASSSVANTIGTGRGVAAGGLPRDMVSLSAASVGASEPGDGVLAFRVE
jgi:hypothetical protein